MTGLEWTLAPALYFAAAIIFIFKGLRNKRQRSMTELTELQRSQLAAQMTFGGNQMSGGMFGGLSSVAHPYDVAQQTLSVTTNTLRGGKGMFKNIGDQITGFLGEYRDPIFWAAILFAVDHYCLDGAFRDRLKRIFERGVKMAEDKLDALAK